MFGEEERFRKQSSNSALGAGRLALECNLRSVAFITAGQTLCLWWSEHWWAAPAQ
jgi:hypothetical protein